MNFKIIFYVILLVLLSGCGGEETDESPSLKGTWITESCEQATDANGSLSAVWMKALYTFTDQNTILLEHELYADLNCTTMSNATNIEGNFNITYQDQGPLLLQEGINGGGIFIETNFNNQLQSLNGYYTINNNVLCFSDAFRFEALLFGISGLGDLAIDFNNCLARP